MIDQETMDRFMHLCNGRDFQQEKKLGFNTAKCYVRDSWGSPRTMSRMEELRGFGCFFEQMKMDIQQSQVYDANRKMVSGCTQFRNGITYQTNAAIQNICFGLPSLLYHYAQICPFGSIFLGDITTDHNERHFNNIKASGAKTIEQLSQAESRGNYHNVLNTALYVKTGLRCVTTSLQKRKVTGNSCAAVDEHLYMKSPAAADGRADKRARSEEDVTARAEEPAQKKRKKRVPLRVNLQVRPTHYQADRSAPRLRLRAGKKNRRAAQGKGKNVAPCGL